MLGEILGLSRPAGVIHHERTLATMRRYVIEARFNDGELCSVTLGFEKELHQCGGLGGRVHAGIDAEGNPAEGEALLGVIASTVQNTVGPSGIVTGEG